MATPPNEKLRILHLLRIFQEKAGDSNHLSRIELQNELLKSGYRVERRTVMDDIAALREFGYNIQAQKGKTTKYYLSGSSKESESPTPSSDVDKRKTIPIIVYYEPSIKEDIHRTFHEINHPFEDLDEGLYYQEFQAVRSYTTIGFLLFKRGIRRILPASDNEESRKFVSDLRDATKKWEERFRRWGADKATRHATARESKNRESLSDEADVSRYLPAHQRAKSGGRSH